MVERPDKVRFGWRSLAMGDLNAVDFMTTGHLNLLRRHGAAREIMRYRSPVPKGSLQKGVIVDEYDTCCIVPRTMRADEPAEDTDALARVSYFKFYRLDNAKGAEKRLWQHASYC